MKSIFNRDGEFKDNVAALEAALGHPISATSCKFILLKKGDDEHLVLPAIEGKFASCALIEYLSDGKAGFTISLEQHEVVRDFFGPIWDQPGHPTIDFLREPGVQIHHIVTDHYVKQTLIHQINGLWDNWETRDKSEDHVYREYTELAFELLGCGAYRVAEPDKSVENGWRTNEWLNKAILLFFRLHTNKLIEGDGDLKWYDKVPLKFTNWTAQDFLNAGLRAVPGSTARAGSFIGKGVILMSGSLVNVGAFVGDNTMVDTGARVGSCAQIGKGVHLSGGVGIGGVLEPPQANPTIIEDDAFIGAISEVAEGVIVRKRAVLSMGVCIGKNTPIVDRTKGNEISRGEVPESAVVMMGVHPSNGQICPIIVKYRDEKTDAATALNEILRGG